MVLKLRRAALQGFVALAWAAPALAQGPPEASAPRFDARLVPSTAVLGATAALAVTPILLARRLPHATCAPCDPADLPPIDRGTVGPVRPAAATVSDIGLIATIGGAGLLLIGEAHGQGGVARENVTVFVQAVATAHLLDNWLKILFARPRPLRYLPTADSASVSPSTGLSFPSGHTTGAMAAAFAYWSIQSRRGTAGGRGTRVTVLISAAALVGVMRIVAREHFPTDVIAAAMLGSAVGWLVPQHYPLQRAPGP